MNVEPQKMWVNQIWEDVNVHKMSLNLYAISKRFTLNTYKNNDDKLIRKCNIKGCTFRVLQEGSSWKIYEVEEYVSWSHLLTKHI